MARIYNKDRDSEIYKFLRDHRIVSNYQLQRAFWPGKQIIKVDTRMKQLATGDYVTHLKIPELRPSNYWLLGKEGFAELRRQELLFPNEPRFILGESGLNITGTFHKKMVVTDIHIALMRHYEDQLTGWMPTFEFESKKQSFGITSSDQKKVIAATPDALLLLRDGADNFKMTVLKYHYLPLKQDAFVKQFAEFEHVWSKYPVIVFCPGAQALDLCRGKYQQEIKKHYEIALRTGEVRWQSIAGRYQFADAAVLPKLTFLPLE